MNNALPQGIEILEAKNYTVKAGQKKYSLSSLLWGFSYRGIAGKEEIIRVADEKKFRAELDTEDTENDFPLRLSVLAKDPEDSEKGKSYFEAYRTFYPLYT
jgi:hypothetical protein